MRGSVLERIQRASMSLKMPVGAAKRGNLARLTLLEKHPFNRKTLVKILKKKTKRPNGNNMLDTKIKK